MNEGSGHAPAQPQAISRRSFLTSAARLGVAASTLGALDVAAWLPQRAAAATARLPDIQFDIGPFIGAARRIDGVLVRFPPVYTSFVTAELTRAPTASDQLALEQALAAVEARYPFSPGGVFALLAYGVPYFERLSGGLDGPLVRGQIPALLRDRDRLALEEAVPGPTDVSAANPDVTKRTFNVPVRIESSDMLIVLRSDSTTIIDDVIAYLTTDRARLGGRAVAPSRLAGLVRVTSRRLMFAQMGLPRRLADRHGLAYAPMIHPRSPMWMGFVDQQVDGSGPAAITTFAGSPSARFTTARAGDYFDNASIVHLSHVIEDLAEFYLTEPYVERVQYMFRSNPIPALGNSDQFTDAGGPAFLHNRFQGAGDAARSAAAEHTYRGERRLGHLSALQRSSRAADGTPVHIRADGPGFDSMDVPDHSLQPKLHFAVFVPTAERFARMRHDQAALDLAKRHGVTPRHNGIERFITATRRQNFLVPPRRHRSFPLVELAAPA